MRLYSTDALFKDESRAVRCHTGPLATIMCELPRLAARHTHREQFESARPIRAEVDCLTVR